MIASKYDAVVVGAGILGTFHAHALAKLGKKVAVFEKDATPREATVRNFGQVVPSGFPNGRWHQYGRFSTELFKSIQTKKDIGIHANGSLYIASDESEMQLLIELKAQFDATDYPSELLTKEQVLAHSSLLKGEYPVGGLFFKQEVSAESRRLIRSIHDFIVETGNVTFFYETAVVETQETNSGVKVKLANGNTVECEKVFICNGRDFQFLYPDIFKQAPIEISKLQMLVSTPIATSLPGNILTGMTIRRYESFKECPSYGQLDPKNAHPELAEKGIHVLFKQRPDGSIVIGDSHVYADNATGFDAGFEEEEKINQLIINEAKEIINVPNLQIAATWSGFYAQMKGHGEIFEHTIGSSIHIVTGIGGKGMTASAGYANEHVQKLFF
ncbi:TIGR03364 family FAD-dependent oxidoreductase [Fluviicola sp.]|uniref:TIGR03364 family FAD-dependent oxidoreductase n=1 Tax=Fluviicola sp. TaxID=1917219 RepID=UPI003D27E105